MMQIKVGLPEVSVIMPVYNTAKYLNESISSILNQTFSNFEFIIINDGSIDESLAIISKYSKTDSRIKVISRVNKGLIYSLNEGISISRGKYIARMDSDDISLPHRLEQQVAQMNSKNLDICGGYYNMIDESGDFIKLCYTPLSHKLCFVSLVSKVPFAHPSVMISNHFLKSKLLKYGQTNNLYAEDLDLWIRMINNGAIFGNVNSVIINYRVLKKSLSRKNKKIIIKETNKLVKDFLILNFDTVKNYLKQIKSTDNTEEDSIIIRALLRISFINFEFKNFRLIFKNKKLTVLKTLISELKIKLI